MKQFILIACLFAIADITHAQTQELENHGSFNLLV
jgi:hypothetical protein